MTSNIERRRNPCERHEDDAAAPSDSVEWPERSHLSEFDAAIRNALAATTSAEDSHAGGLSGEPGNSPSSDGSGQSAD